MTNQLDFGTDYITEEQKRREHFAELGRMGGSKTSPFKKRATAASLMKAREQRRKNARLRREGKLV